MTDTTPAAKKPTDVTISRAKGRPMLSWVGKKPLGRVSHPIIFHLVELNG
ncbi:MAG: hypothetical protein WA134_07980 [Rhodoferax sp.]